MFHFALRQNAPETKKNAGIRTEQNPYTESSICPRAGRKRLLVEPKSRRPKRRPMENNAATQKRAIPVIVAAILSFLVIVKNSEKYRNSLILSVFGR